MHSKYHGELTPSSKHHLNTQVVRDVEVNRCMFDPTILSSILQCDLFLLIPELQSRQSWILP